MRRAVEDSDAELKTPAEALAEKEGPVVSLFRASDAGYPLDFLVTERSISHNTAAAGGSASLMSL